MFNAHAYTETNFDKPAFNEVFSQTDLWPILALTTPASGFLLRPLLNVEAKVEEQLSSYRAVRPSLMAELMEIVHMLEA